MTLTIALAATACAGARVVPTHQADHAGPGAKDLGEGGEQISLKEAQAHLDRGDQARDSGNADQARAEWKEGAAGLMHLVELYPASPWRLVHLRTAAEAFVRAQEYPSAIEAAGKISVDPQAAPASRAFAARVTAAGWQAIAIGEVKAGKLEPIRLLTHDKRKGEKLDPRLPPGSWKRFVDSADAYVALARQDPDASRPAGDPRSAARAAPELALFAAEVEYGFDNLEEARKRFEVILATWPSDAAVMEAAVSLHLQTFLLAGDGEEAYVAALDRSKALIDAQAKQASAAAQAPDASPEVKKSAATFRSLADQLARARQGTSDFAARKLLETGKPAEAAAAFEAFAEQVKNGPDAPLALYNAAVAWEKAGQFAKADTDRRRVLEEYADSRIAPSATLALAGSLSRHAGDHAEAEHLYAVYLDRWPAGEQRCLAMLNVGYESDQQGEKAEAAARYRAYGEDGKCAKEDPSGAARALYRAGVLFLEVKQLSEAKASWKTLAGMVGGALDAVAKSQVEDARRRWKRIKLR